MSLTPRTLWAIACNDCAVTFGVGTDGDFCELQMAEPTDVYGWAAAMRDRGWAVTDRHLCPACVAHRAGLLGTTPTTHGRDRADHPTEDTR